MAAGTASVAKTAAATRAEGSWRESRSVGTALFALAIVEALILAMSVLFVPLAGEAALAEGDSRIALSILGILTVIVGVQFVLEAERLAERVQLSPSGRRKCSNLTIVEGLLCYAAVLFAVATVVGVLFLVFLPGVSSVRLELELISVGLVAAVVVAFRLTEQRGRWGPEAMASRAPRGRCHWRELHRRGAGAGPHVQRRRRTAPPTPEVDRGLRVFTLLSGATDLTLSPLWTLP
jgi:hypothetical protein